MLYSVEDNVQHKQKKRRKTQQNQTDISLIFIVIFLIVFGVIMIYSSSIYKSLEDYNNSTYFFKRQLVWGALGIVVMLIVSKIDYHFFNKFAGLLYIICIGTLILVLFVGRNINGAKRWLDIGPLRLQPSELTKLAIVIVVAYLCTRLIEHLDKIRMILLILAVMCLPTALIGIENMSTAIVVACISIAILFAAVPKLSKLLLVIIPPAAIGAILGVVLFSYRSARIKIWLEGPWTDPLDKGYQTIQSLYAIGSGGLFGIGLGQSMQKNGFIPEAHNDIIFSIVCEELGLFGALILILLFVLLIWRCMVIASKAADLNGLLIVIGVMSQIAIQVIINIAVVTNSIPATGMPLPFISYGGSSLLFLLTEIGLVLSVGRASKIKKTG